MTHAMTSFGLADRYRTPLKVQCARALMVPPIVYPENARRIGCPNRIVDDTSRIVREVKIASEPEALLGDVKESRLPLQADRAGSRAAVALAPAIKSQWR